MASHINVVTPPNGEVKGGESYGLSNSAASPDTGPRYGYTKDGIGYLVGNSDSELNAINQQALWDREDLLRQAGNKWDAKALDRIIEAGKRNGINPIFLLDALNAGGTSASYTTSAAKANNYDTNAKTDAANSAKIVGGLLAAIAMIVAAAL